jgi:chaperone modulatory protein CbpM
MTTVRTHTIVSLVVEEQMQFTWGQLCRACRAEPQQLLDLVQEGLLMPLLPTGDAPEDWRFGGQSLAVARRAMRLRRDFELDPAAAVLVMNLLTEIDDLRRRLLHLGLQ